MWIVESSCSSQPSQLINGSGRGALINLLRSRLPAFHQRFNSRFRAKINHKSGAKLPRLHREVRKSRENRLRLVTLKLFFSIGKLFSFENRVVSSCFWLFHRSRSSINNCPGKRLPTGSEKAHEFHQRATPCNPLSHHRSSSVFLSERK